MMLSLDVENTGKFGRGFGYILLDEVQCRGNESKLSECSHAGINNNNCDHSDDIGVICGKPIRASVKKCFIGMHSSGYLCFITQSQCVIIQIFV